MTIRAGQIQTPDGYVEAVAVIDPTTGQPATNDGLTNAQLRASPVPISSTGTTPIAAAKFFTHILGQDGTVNDSFADCNLAGNYVAPSQRIVYRTFATGGRITGIGFAMGVTSGQTIAQLGYGSSSTVFLTTGIGIELVAANPTNPAQAAVAVIPSSRIRATADLITTGWRETTDRATAVSMALFLDLSAFPLDVPVGWSVRAIASENTAINNVDRINVSLRYIDN